jgi:nicotinate phosphoribosyltransferase
LAHDDERSAFEAQVATLGASTTLLVDTYDVEQGIRTAVEVAGLQLGAIRLDSGDLLSQAKRARELLDDLGATDTRIVVTSDLDESSIAQLASAPVDSYGVGTSVVTGGGVPTAGFVYKLVARAGAEGWASAEKRSVGKKSRGGRKWPARQRRDGVAVAEHVWVGEHPAAHADDERPLLVPVVRNGEVVVDTDLAAAREHCRHSLAELPPTAMQLSAGDPAIVTRYEDVRR